MQYHRERVSRGDFAGGEREKQTSGENEKRESRRSRRGCGTRRLSSWKEKAWRIWKKPTRYGRGVYFK